MAKTCIICHIEKELDQFYKHPQMADKHLNKCIACCIEYERVRRIYDPDAIRMIEKRKKRKSATIHTRQWRLNNPEKYKAHTLLNNAVRSGKIIKPELCEVCGESGYIHAHHSDYAKPLEVVWLCAKCHGQIQ